MKAIDWINYLNMSRHPEGGYYKEIFRSEKLVDNDKSAMTSIYYLLENEDKSAFHRLTSPEVWYYHAGYPLMLHVIHPDGRLVTHLMTADFRAATAGCLNPDVGLQLNCLRISDMHWSVVLLLPVLPSMILSWVRSIVYRNFTRIMKIC